MHGKRPGRSMDKKQNDIYKQYKYIIQNDIYKNLMISFVNTLSTDSFGSRSSRIFKILKSRKSQFLLS